MRNYTDKKYAEITEIKPNPILKQQMDKELELILNIKDSKEKTFIDLGAGHGRLTRTLANISRNLISIEINPKMLPELKKRSSEFQNSKVIVGDITNLTNILKYENIQKPVLLLVQNSLGTIEGNWKKVLIEMKKVAKRNKGEIIISFFRQEALKDWGINLYNSIIDMVGEPDFLKIDFSKGLFVSKTGYVSKWRSKKEIEDIKEFFNGRVVDEVWSKNWYIINISY